MTWRLEPKGRYIDLVVTLVIFCVGIPALGYIFSCSDSCHFPYAAPLVWLSFVVELLVPMDIQGGRGNPHTPWQLWPMGKVIPDGYMTSQSAAYGNTESDVLFPGQHYLCSGASWRTLGLPILPLNWGLLQLLAEAADAICFLALSW